ncbi:hypothetical protein A2U01_0004772, partial [Trifolium medium]|nr:hypothetical protein [Trifolium medium]
MSSTQDDRETEQQYAEEPSRQILPQQSLISAISEVTPVEEAPLWGLSSICGRRSTMEDTAS